MRAVHNDDPSLVGIGLIPCRKDSERLVRVHLSTRAIEEWQDMLGHANCLPHLSLLHANVSHRDDVVGRMASWRGATGIGMVFGEIADVEYIERGWYFINLVASDQIVALHRQVFELLRELLKPGVIRDRASFDLYRATEKENFLRYGYRYVLEDHHPHVTLGRTLSLAKSAGHERIIEVVENELPDQLLFDELVVFEIGRNGTFAGKLWGCPLE